MRTTVIAVVAVLALLCFVSIGVEAAGAPVRRLARATAAPAEVGLTPKEICVAKCAAESAVCVYKCEHPGMLGGCKENCAITAAECAAECAFEAEAPVATMVVPESAFTGVKAAEKELVATTVVPESAFVKAPASSDINGQCMVKCAADAAYCAYECFHQNSTSKVVCDEKCAAEAAECAGTCVDPVQVSAATEKIMALADVAVALVSEPKAQQLSQAVQVNAEPVAECLAECAAEAAYCVFECPVNPSGGMLGGCKEVCAIKAAACTARCVMPPTEKAVTVPAVIDSSNVEAALAAATKVESGIMTPQVSALCLAKCAATGAYCVYQCVHTNGPVGCKTTCGIEAAACAGECVVAPTSQLQLAAISDNVMEAASKAVALVDATPAASSVAVAQVGAPEISPLCLAKCAAEAGVCVYKCLHPGLLGGCKESCALKAAECSGLCLLALPAPQKEVNSDNIVEVFAAANANKQVAAPANKNTCVFNCVKASSGCADKCHKGDDQCLQNCLTVSAQCCANCYNVDEEAPVAVTVVPESAFTGVVAAPVASTEIAVGGDGICLAKCAAEAAVCVYKCLHPMGGLLGGCKEDCAITAAECSGECLIAATPAVAAKQLPALTSSAAREVVATASKAVALVEASPAAASVAAVSQVEVGPLTPICLAKCAAEAAVCVYKCEHPSKGLLGGCKEDCALKAAECSGECLL